MIHLDTCFLIDLMREARRGPGPARRTLDTLRDQRLGISLYVLCELYAGTERADNPQREHAKIEDLLRGVELVLPDPGMARVYARLLDHLRRRGAMIGTMDLLIAATAVRSGAPLVTRNQRELGRVPTLEIVPYG